MLSHLKLGSKFTLLLLLVFIIGSSLGGAALSAVLQKRSQAQISAEGLMLMQTINAVREYTNQQIRPLLESTLQPGQFVSEIVPSYSARQVFEGLHKNPEYADMLYKEAVINPTNPADEADEFEKGLVNQFRREPSTQEISGFRSLPGRRQVYFSARPIVVTEQSCLRCHSTPAAAPPEMLAIYGSDRGFGWQLDVPSGTQIVYVPATDVMQSAQRAFSSVMGIFVGVFAVTVVLINLLLKPTVLQPIQQLARVSQKLGSGDMQAAPPSPPDNANAERQAAANAEVETARLAKVATRNDELGQLAKVFQHMVQEVIAREQSLRKTIQDLRIEIDHSRRAREVAEITDNTDFLELKKKAQEFRRRRQQNDPKKTDPA